VKKAVDEFVAKGFVKAIQIKGGQFILKKKSMDNSQGSAK